MAKLTPNVKTDSKGEPLGNIDALLADYRDIQRQMNELELRKKKIRNHLEKNLAVGSHTFGEVKVLIYKSKRVDMDKEKLKVLLGAKFDLYTKVSHFIGVRVTDAKATDEEDPTE